MNPKSNPGTSNLSAGWKDLYKVNRGTFCGRVFMMPGEDQDQDHHHHHHHQDYHHRHGNKTVELVYQYTI